MKINYQLIRVIYITVVLALFSGNSVFSQESSTKKYRRPSEQDIQWLLNISSTDAESSAGFAACRVERAPTCAGGLRNPACPCERCGESDPESRETRLGIPQSVAGAVVPASYQDMESRGRIVQVANTEPEPPSNPVVPQPLPEAKKPEADKPESPRNRPAPAVLPPKDLPGPNRLDVDRERINEKIEADRPCITKQDARLPKSCEPVRMAIPNACQKTGPAPREKIETPPPCTQPTAQPTEKPITRPCEQPVGQPCAPPPCDAPSSGAKVEDVSKVLKPYVPTRQQACSPCGAVGGCSPECGKCKRAASPFSDYGKKLFRHSADLYRARSCHDKACSCPDCRDWLVPDMVGDVSSVPGRFVGLRTRSISGVSDIRIAPSTLLSRLNMAENFNVETRDRLWFDYRYLSNAAVLRTDSRRKSTGVSQGTLGLEKKLMPCLSFEMRIPFLHQFDSRVSPIRPDETSLEVGNMALAVKYLFARTKRYSLAAGLGMTLPTADDWKIHEAGAILKNKAYDLVPFLGLQWHPDERNFGHLLVQVDIPISDNELHLGRDVVETEEQVVVRCGVQVGRWFHVNPCKTAVLGRAGGFLELDYMAALDNVSKERIATGRYTLYTGSTKRRAQTLNLVAGIPMIVGKCNLSNAVIVPLYNDDRSFSIAYDFSITRRF